MAAPRLPGQGTLFEYREYPDGTVSAVIRDTGACCQDCGSRNVLKRYREYPDGSLVYVDDTSVCCSCASNTLIEYREYPDLTLVRVRDTGACCDCGQDGCCGCGDTAAYIVDNVEIDGAAACCQKFKNYLSPLPGAFLPLNAVTCQWTATTYISAPPGTLCEPGDTQGLGVVTWVLECDDNDFILRIGVAYGCQPSNTGCSSNAVYKLAKSLWLCDGPNVMALDSADSCDWPATATVRAA